MSRKTKLTDGSSGAPSKGKGKESTAVDAGTSVAPDAETSVAPSNAVTLEGQRYVLTFNDEFNGSTASYWMGHGKGGVWATSYSPHLQDSRTNAANNELQYYVDPDMLGLPDPFTVDGGVMTIHASQLDDGQKELTGGLDYGSGMLSTEMSFSIDGGYIEISADIPDQLGLWSAFWLMPSDGDWSAEIDVFEYLGDTGDTLFTNLWDQGTPDPLQVENSGAGDGFHTYGLYWDDAVIRWTFDGVTIRESANTVQEDMYLIFNLAVGGWAGEPGSTTDFTDGFSIDYIRVYELESDPYRNAEIKDGEFQGADTHGGTSGDDILHGSRWADILDGSSGHDTLYGDGGDDHLNGGSGDDCVFGQAGDDVLSGGAGNDEIVGGLGSDILISGAGTDHLWGGSYGFDGSSDTFVFTNGTGKDYIHDFEAGLDQIDLSDFSFDWYLIWQNISDLGWATYIDLASLGGGVDDEVYMVGSNIADLSARDFGFDSIA